MTKKDYEMIAKVIKDNTEWYRSKDNYGESIEQKTISATDFMVVLGMAFKKDNPNFDERKFWQACDKPYPEDWK